MYPSAIAHTLSGIIIFYVILKLVYNKLTDTSTLTLIKSSQTNTFLLTLAIALGIHGLAHAYSEVNFGFNPLEGEWDYKLKNKTK